MKNYFEQLFGGVLALFGFMFGNEPNAIRLVTAFLIFVVFDFVTGFMKAKAKKDINSFTFETGFMKKILMIICISFCFFIDKYQLLNVGINLECATATFFIFGEIISILENFIELGIKLPQPLINVLTKAQQENGVVSNEKSKW